METIEIDFCLTFCEFIRQIAIYELITFVWNVEEKWWNFHLGFMLFYYKSNGKVQLLPVMLKNLNCIKTVLHNLSPLYFSLAPTWLPLHHMSKLVLTVVVVVVDHGFWCCCLEPLNHFSYILLRSAQHSTAQHSTAQHCTAQNWQKPSSGEQVQKNHKLTHTHTHIWGGMLVLFSPVLQKEFLDVSANLTRTHFVPFVCVCMSELLQTREEWYDIRTHAPCSRA